MGWRQWVIGARPTAAQLNTDIQEQTINRCTSTTRPASSVCTDGMHIYETDTTKYYRWSGPPITGAWVEAFGNSPKLLAATWTRSSAAYAGSSTIATVTGSSASVTLAATRTVLVVGHIGITAAAASTVLIQITNSGGYQWKSYAHPGGGVTLTFLFTSVQTLAAGSHTFTCQVQSASALTIDTGYVDAAYTILNIS